VELEEFVNKMGPALADVLNVKVPEEVNETLMGYTGIGSIKRDKYTVKRYILSHDKAGDQIPAILYTPKGGAEKKMANLIIYPEGKAALVDFENAMPSNAISEMLNKDFMVLAIDTFLTGDHHSPFEKTERERYGRYFTTFNPVNESLKVQDILTAISYLQSRPDVAGVNLIGIGEAGLWCLLANAFAKGISKTVADVVGFDNRDDSQWVKHLNIPGILRVGGFDTALACSAPRPLLIHNTGGKFDADRMKTIYDLLNQSEKLKIISGQISDREILGWLEDF